MKIFDENQLTSSLAIEEIELAPKKQINNKYLTIDELSDLLQIPKSWIYERTRKNQIPHKRIGKYLRFDQSEIENWINRSNSKLNNSSKRRL